MCLKAIKRMWHNYMERFPPGPPGTIEYIRWRSHTETEENV